MTGATGNVLVKRKEEGSIPINKTENVVGSLPNEIWTLIFSYGDRRDWCNWERVCKSWKVLCRDDGLWKGPVQRAFPKSVPIGEELKNCRGINGGYIKLSSHYKNKTFTNKVLTESIPRGNWGNTHKFNDHYVCKRNGGKLLIGTSSFIDVWNLKDKTKEANYSFSEKEHYIIGKEHICMTDVGKDEIVLLDPLTLKKRDSLSMKKGSFSATPHVFALHLEGKYLAVGTKAGSIELWDLDQKKCLRNFQSDRMIAHVFVKEDKIYSVDHHIRADISIFDISTGSKSNLKIEGLISALLIKNGRIFVGHDKKITVFEEKTHRELWTFSPDVQYLDRLFVEKNILIAGPKASCADDSKFGCTKAWDIDTMKEWKLFDSSFSFLDGEEGKFYVLDNDNRVVEWDFTV